MNIDKLEWSVTYINTTWFWDIAWVWYIGGCYQCYPPDSDSPVHFRGFKNQSFLEKASGGVPEEITPEEITGQEITVLLGYLMTYWYPLIVVMIYGKMYTYVDIYIYIYI